MTPLQGLPTQPMTVVLDHQDLMDAARAGVITAAQAQELWQRWAFGAQSHTAAPGPRFGFVNVLYYFGGMVAIGAMSLFMTLGFQIMGAAGLLAIALGYAFACLKVADHFKAKGLVVPAGILATLAVVLVPLALWCVQNLLGLWPEGGSRVFAAYHTRIDWRWLMLEFGTLAAAAVLLWRYKLPFMVMPVAVTLWYMSMDVAHGLMQGAGWDYKFMRDVSLVFGLGTCAMAMWVDMRSRLSRSVEWRQDFAFWLYIFGAIMFWGALSLRDSSNEWGKFLYALLNIAHGAVWRCHRTAGVYRMRGAGCGRIPGLPLAPRVSGQSAVPVCADPAGFGGGVAGCEVAAQRSGYQRAFKPLGS
jgi:hypothetical protein